MIVLRIEAVAHNPMDKVHLPTVKREKKKEIDFFGRDELVIFLDEAYKHGDKLGVFGTQLRNLYS